MNSLGKRDRRKKAKEDLKFRIVKHGSNVKQKYIDFLCRIKSRMKILEPSVDKVCSSKLKGEYNIYEKTC